MRTYCARPADIKRRWFIVDATDQILGRLASGIATVLQGKHRPTWTPHIDCGDAVVVINAAKVRVTGRKADQKVYTRHTRHIGGLVKTRYEEMLAGHPERILALAVKRMLPKNALAVHQLAKLKVYAGADHPHTAQAPEALKFGRSGPIVRAARA